MPQTTIKITDETKERLEKLKEHKKETYEEVLKKIFWILNMFKVSPIQARKKLREIEFVRMKEQREKFLQEKFLKDEKQQDTSPVNLRQREIKQANPLNLRQRGIKQETFKK